MTTFKPVTQVYQESLTNARNCIHNKIDNAVKEGCFHIFVPSISDEVRQELLALGYKIYNHDMTTGCESIEIDWHV